ncbi:MULTISPECIES: ParA family protein [Cyanophyceae]|uniref:ParA family protein n=1 Tax=Cyanophyceae TaxID=3028117 RepID=UPI001687A37F|nr:MULTISPECIES: ParA family protein [Cyanophyceae]MBD1918450.1 ParA family protein [Phormidium sp. FACHB-77]MBD2031339.1 ParA family protein [Phormidium sp. FACHB-322]MBD2049459.1 ParA family protein [Leptolyngbya sp. FACHB-60]
MIVTVASFKGGVGKTTTAIHLAAFLQGYAETLLIDADPNQSALAWASRGELPFLVVDQWQARELPAPHGHVVIDTQARPIAADLALLAASCDLLVLPSTPDILALDALAIMVEHLVKLPVAPYRILLTMIPPYPSRAGAEVRTMLMTTGLPLFVGGIRRYSAFQKAALAGTAVYDVKDPKAEVGWQDYMAVGKEILTYALEMER